MKVLRDILGGLGQVLVSPTLAALPWLMTLVFALPLGLLMEQSLRSDVGKSLIHERLRDGLDLGWLEEFRHQGGELASALTPTRVSAAAPLDNLEAWFSAAWAQDHRGLAAWGLLFALVWTLLQGGVLEHLANRPRRFELTAFCAACGSYFLRFLRLAVLMGGGYFLVYRGGRWIFPRIVTWTRDVTVEEVALAWHLTAALAVVAALTLLHLVADFARIATVREDRRSAVLALARALGLVMRHPLQAVALHGILAAGLLASQVAYFMVAKDPTGASPLALALAFGVGQLYLLVRWTLRLTLCAAEIRMFDRWTDRQQGGGSPAF